MYMKRMFEIGQATNGYVVECRAPIKKKERENAKETVSEYQGSCEKQFIAKDSLSDRSNLPSSLDKDAFISIVNATPYDKRVLPDYNGRLMIILAPYRDWETDRKSVV